jgi:hypothetical protein
MMAGPGGKLMLFSDARTTEELLYFGPLVNLPRDFIDTTLTFHVRRVGRSGMCRMQCASMLPTLRTCFATQIPAFTFVA